MLQFQISNSFTERTIRCTTKIGRYAIGDHIHQNTEIAFVHDGCIDVTVDGRTERAYKNDLIIISPFRVHSFHTESYAKVWISVFSNDFISDFLPEDGSYIYGERTVFSPSESLLNFFLPKLIDSNENLIIPNTSDMLRIKTVFYAIMEEYFSVVPHRGVPPKSTALSAILTYLLEHYKENITLADVSRSIGYNTNYISHCLRELGSLNFRTVLNSFRIEQAKRMLLSRKHKMIDIALECGFTCERTFYRAFLQITGTAPSDYREARIDANFITAGGEKTKHSQSIHIPVNPCNK